MQRVQIVLIDDLDGSEGAETVTFGLDGTTYEIDLSEANAASLREALAPYLAKANRVSPTGKARQTRKRASTSNSATEIRAWAQEQGMAVSARGRVPAEIRQAYEAAHS